MNQIVWNADWSQTRVHWPSMFGELGLTGKPGLRFMEIGCFEGQSALWLLENVLTDETSQLVMIDPLEFTEISGEDQWTRIRRHLAPYFASGQVEFLRGPSEDVLRGWTADTLVRNARFDLVYIDGDHFPAGVIKDAVLTWPLLKPGGHLLFDDYVYELGGHPGPRAAIEAFVEFYAMEIESHRLVGADQYLVRTPQRVEHIDGYDEGLPE